MGGKRRFCPPLVKSMALFWYGPLSSHVEPWLGYSANVYSDVTEDSLIRMFMQVNSVESSLRI
jgi:hypothetical protein